MSVFWILLGKVIRLATGAAFVYLLWNGRWRVILIAIGFSFVTPAVTALVNIPMKVFWSELGYPESLSAPGLSALVKPWRLVLVYRIPQFVYGGLAYAIGLAAFALFSASTSALDRAALLLTGYETGFTVPTSLANSMAAEQNPQGLYLSSQLFYGKMAFLTLLIVHTITPLSFWPAVAVLTAGMVAIQVSFELAAWRRSMLQNVAWG